MNRPIQSGIRLNPPSGLPQQTVAPTGLPNVNQINTGLPNIIQQPTGLPPTQMQMPTPPAVPPVEQSNSMFAPPPQMQQPMQRIDPSLAQIQGGPYNPPQMQQPAPQPIAPQQTQPMQQPPNQFANEPGRDSNGMLIPGYGEPPPGTFLSQPVDKPGDIYGGLTPGQALGGEYTMQQPVAGPIAPQQPTNGMGGRIDPSFAQIGFGRFQDEYGNFIT
jgi:hypothetical protein